MLQLNQENGGVLSHNTEHVVRFRLNLEVILQLGSSQILLKKGFYLTEIQCYMYRFLVTYAKRKGKYMKQKGVTLPKV